MGVIGKIHGSSGATGAVGATVRDVAQVFTPDAHAADELSAEAQAAALAQHGAEFAGAGEGWFDRAITG